MTGLVEITEGMNDPLVIPSIAERMLPVILFCLMMTVVYILLEIILDNRRENEV